MIQANKSKLFARLFYPFNVFLLKKSFQNIYVTQKEDAFPPASIFILNHSSWWDGLLCFHLNQTLLKTDSYHMMHEKGLKQFPFFRKLGGFSINRNNPKDIVQSFQYAKKMLMDNKSIWLFPQGDEFHLETRPLKFMPGISYLAEQVPHVPIIPICLYYSFRHKKKPEVFISIDNPIFITSLKGNNRVLKAKALEEMFTMQLDSLKNQIINEDIQSFQPLLRRNDT
ncbi:lysophospholipid acyltransferase family protein [Bacillus timonensis]|nr:lysophospholipid acyltransferase family protein [Bacillus timonensis]